MTAAAAARFAGACQLGTGDCFQMVIPSPKSEADAASSAGARNRGGDMIIATRGATSSVSPHRRFPD
eukprot:4860897-Prymnesium_polylepis.3